MARGNSALADRGFRVLMVILRFSIFGIVVLILSELMLRSSVAWHSFGLRFFFMPPAHDPISGQTSYWDPVNGHFSALPFIYGTLVSSLLSLLIAVPLAIGLAIFLTEMCQGIARSASVCHGIAGCNSKHHLRPVGGVRFGPVAAGVCKSAPVKYSGGQDYLPMTIPRAWAMSRRRDSGNHDFADYLVADSRSDDGGSAFAA